MKKTILIASPHFPYPVYGGGHVALFNEVNALRSICNVVYACPYAAKDHIDTLKRTWPDVKLHILSTEEVTLHWSMIRWIKKVLLTKTQGNDMFYLQKPFIESFFSTAYIIDEYWMQFLINIVKETKCDIIQTEFYPLLNNVSYLPKEITRIFVNHEIGFVKLKRGIALTDFSELYKQTIAENLIKTEVMLLNKYDKVIVFSENDKNALINAGVKTVVSSPFPYVPCEMNNKPFAYNGKLVFIGGESNYPNLDGLTWFIREIWPEIKSSDEKTELFIIGKWSGRTIKKMSGRNIRFLGYVDKLDKIIQNAISIVPIRIGSGLRVKIIESLSNNVPVISTSVGAEGLPVSELPGVLIADSAPTFAEKIKYISLHKENLNSFLSISQKTIRDQFSVEHFLAIRQELMGIN